MSPRAARRGPAQGPRRGILGWVLAVSILALLGVAGLGTVRYLQDPRHLPLRQVQILGEFTHLRRRALEERVAGVIDGGFFTVDMQAVRDAVRALPWVDSVSVRRVWPDTLALEVHEQRPLARWGAKALVNARGEVFRPAPEALPEGLVQLFGPPGSAARVVSLYRRSHRRLERVGLRLRSLGQGRRHDWQLRFRDGLGLSLGREGVSERLERFLHVWPLLREERGRRPAQVDLRYEHGLAVRWRAADGEPAAADGATNGGNGV